MRTIDTMGVGFAPKHTVKTLLDLNLYSKAHKLSMILYGQLSNIPHTDTYHLSSRIKRATSSLGAALAECESDRTHKVIFKEMSKLKSALKEIKSWLWMAFQQGYIEQSVYKKLVSGYQELAESLHLRSRNSEILYLF